MFWVFSKNINVSCFFVCKITICASQFFFGFKFRIFGRRIVFSKFATTLELPHFCPHLLKGELELVTLACLDRDFSSSTIAH